MTALAFSHRTGGLVPVGSPNAEAAMTWTPELLEQPALLTSQGVAKLMKSSYVGVNVRSTVVYSLNEALRGAMGPKLFSRIQGAKSARDGHESYHMTLVTPAEYRRLKSQGALSELPQDSFRYRILGVGVAHSAKSSTWFAVVESPEIDRWRLALNLPKHELHITLGFTSTDLHGVSKGQSTLV